MEEINNLVTGGAGFIGSNLIKHLLKKDEKVICLDNFTFGNLENISKLIKNPKFKIIKNDIRHPLDIENINKIWHFASIASPNNYLKSPINTAKINFLGTLNMLELAKKNNAKFLFASTSEIYGNEVNYPINEFVNGILKTQNSRSCYFESKRLSETICFDYARQFNLDIKVARIFNSYGFNMSLSDGRVIGNFLKQSFKSEPLTIYGDGKQTRSFCFISDLISGLEKLMNSSQIGPINLGNPEEIEIKSLAEKICKKNNKEIKFSYQNELIDEPKRRKPCIKLAKKLLNWEPKISLEEGLDLTIDFFKKNRNLLICNSKS